MRIVHNISYLFCISCFICCDGENFHISLYPDMPDCVLKRSIPIFVPWDLHLNFSCRMSKMLKWNLKQPYRNDA